MGKVVVVTSGKGGVGKTTSTAALGAALAQNKEKVVVVGQPQTTEQFGFVVRKGETELLNKLNVGLEKLEANGTLKQLEAKWFR